MSRRSGIVAMALLAIAGGGCRSGAAPRSNGPASSADTLEVDARAPAAAASPSDASPSDASPSDASPSDAGAVAAATPTDAGEAPEGMALVPGGTFTMGQDTGGEGDERPAHKVTLAAFWLDRTEVTQAAYEACVAAKACPAPDAASLETFGGLFKGAQKPVVGVSWFAARDYCAWRGKRLPREAEFERAVRGDDGRRFPWGADAPTHERTVFETSAPEAVGTHPAGRGPYGHDDLAGNVWEWLDDSYDPFAYTRAGAAEGKPGTCDAIVTAQNKLRAENKQGFTGSNPIPTECEKSIRGGAYNYPAGGLRSTNRVHHPPSFKLRMTGMRCAKDA
jgi:formylglycine-generating enzyme required for sulfatase activity